MTRVILAVVITLALGVPALIGPLWQVSPLAQCLFVLNLPGILATIPHVPPEGFPGQSFPRAIAMLLIQIVVWYILLSFVAFIRSRFARNHT